MPVWKQQNSFTGGEISPRLEGRTDLKQYGNSVAELENFFPHSYGGIAKAPGLYFVCEVKDSSKGAVLIEFERKVGQTYILELGDYYMRFIRDGARIEIDFVPYEIVTPWTLEEAKELSFCQSVDVMWMVHENHPPKRLGRYAETDWRIEDEDFIDGPFGPINASGTTMYPSAATGTVSVTVNGTVGINNGAGFLSTDVGRHIRIYDNEAADPADWVWGWGIITAVTNTQLITVSVQGGSFPTVNPTTYWKLGVFSDSTGYPREVMFFEQRIVYGGTTLEPQGVWLSQTDAYNIFTVSDPIVDSDACSFVLVADQTNDIAWMMASRELAIGTLGGEWTLTGAEGRVISPTSVNAKRYTTNGGAGIRPIHVGGSILFVDRARRALLEMAYVFEDDGYNSPDLLLLADHITREAQIVDTAWQGSPDSKLYCVLDNGELAVLTYKRDQEVIGWARRTTQGLFEATASVSSSYRDVPYFVVNRTINGVTKRFIEWMKSDFGDAVEPVPVIPGGTLPTAVNELFGVGGGDWGTFGSGSYLWEIDSALDGTQVQSGFPVSPHPLPDFNYRKQFGTRIFTSGSKAFRLGLCLFGKIGGKLYFNNHEILYQDSAYQPNWKIEQYDVLNGQSKTWTFTGLEAYITGNSRHNDYHFTQCAIGWDKDTDTKTLYFILCKKDGQELNTGIHYLMEGVFNDVTGKIDVDATKYWDFNAQIDMDDAYPCVGYAGGARMGVNSTHLFIPYRNADTLGAWQSGVWMVERESPFGPTSDVGHFDTLQMWMKSEFGTELFSPEIVCCANDGYLFIIHGGERDSALNDVDGMVYVLCYQLGEDGLPAVRMFQANLDLHANRTDGFDLDVTDRNYYFFSDLNDQEGCGLEGIAVDGDYLYLSWLGGRYNAGYSAYGSWITKWKMVTGKAPWTLEHVTTFRSGKTPENDRCEVYSIVIDEQNGYY